MIDEVWLSSLRFQRRDGSAIVGFLGAGAETVVLRMRGAAGENQVLKMPRTHLGFSIREIPPELEPVESYDVSRLNRKLRLLVGTPSLDAICMKYDRMYSGIVALLHRYGTTGLILAMPDPDNTPFILQSEGLTRRLQVIECLPEEEGQIYVLANGNHTWMGKYVVEGFPSNLRLWAKETLASIRKNPMMRSRLAPETLHNNPLYVWGGAMLDGFFTLDETDGVAAYLKAEFNLSHASEEAILWFEQICAVIDVMAFLDKNAPVDRLLHLCNSLGFRYVR